MKIPFRLKPREVKLIHRLLTVEKAHTQHEAALAVSATTREGGDPRVAYEAIVAFNRVSALHEQFAMALEE